MSNYITNAYDLMVAIKYNLQKKAIFDVTTLNPDVKTWNIGFVFPESLAPTITVFPSSKTFNPKQSNGRTPVDYRFSIDIYSKKHRYLDDAKNWVLRANEMVSEIVKSSSKMKDTNNKLHCYSTKVEDIRVIENKEPSNRGFKVRGSVDIVCTALHIMNPARVVPPKYMYIDAEQFIDQVFEYLQKGMINDRVQQWQHKIARSTTKYPSVILLPKSEIFNELYTNRNALISREYTIYNFSAGYPKKELLKSNIEISDLLVSSLERNYALGGYASYSNVNSIDYRFSEIDSNMKFYSNIDVEYFCRRYFSKTIT